VVACPANGSSRRGSPARPTRWTTPSPMRSSSRTGPNRRRSAAGLWCSGRWCGHLALAAPLHRVPARTRVRTGLGPARASPPPLARSARSSPATPFPSSSRRGRLLFPDSGRPRRGPPGACHVSAPVLLVRLLPGIVGESRRVVHVVAAPADTRTVPEVLTALCGEQIKPGTAEVLPDLGGMPCGPCFLAATPQRQPTTTDRRIRTSRRSSSALQGEHNGQRLRRGSPSRHGKQPHKPPLTPRQGIVHVTALLCPARLSDRAFAGWRYECGRGWCGRARRGSVSSGRWPHDTPAAGTAVWLISVVPPVVRQCSKR
jgi:hypothetical protein